MSLPASQPPVVAIRTAARRAKPACQTRDTFKLWTPAGLGRAAAKNTARARAMTVTPISGPRKPGAARLAQLKTRMRTARAAGSQATRVKKLTNAAAGAARDVDGKARRLARGVGEQVGLAATTAPASEPAARLGVGRAKSWARGVRDGVGVVVGVGIGVRLGVQEGVGVGVNVAVGRGGGRRVWVALGGGGVGVPVDGGW